MLSLPSPTRERLLIMLTEDELSALDDWRFRQRMPSRAAAVRELLRRGLAAEGVDLPGARLRSIAHAAPTAPSPRRLSSEPALE